MKTVVVKCFWCQKEVVKTTKEVKRSLTKGMRLFCNNSCGAKWVNTGRKKAVTVIKPCEYCGKEFETRAFGSRVYRFCSRPCGSAGSVTDKRRESSRQAAKRGINLLRVSDSLKKREAWKYEQLRGRLSGIDHEFEYDLGGFVFDLAFPIHKIVVEFDGPEHSRKTQKIADGVKTKAAESLGFTVIRKVVAKGEVIPSAILDDFLQVRTYEVAVSAGGLGVRLPDISTINPQGIPECVSCGDA